ncbi:MAG: glycosyltransferase [Bacteroidota bacterium]
MEQKTFITGLVSVVIPTRNRVNLLQRAIKSVQNQSYKQIEILVVNDGSTDKTRKYLEHLAAQTDNIRAFHNYPSRGACNARNVGVQNAKGEYLTLLDDDDEYLSKRIEILLRYIKVQPELAFVCSGFFKVLPDKRMLVNNKRKILTLENVFWKNTMGNSMLTFTSKIRTVGGFDEQLTSAQDYDLFVRLIKQYGRALRIEEGLLIQHTEHGGARIANHPDRYKGLLRFYRKHAKDMTLAQRQYFSYKYRKSQHRIGDLTAFSKAFWDLPFKYKYLEIGHFVKKFFTQGTSYFKKR